MTAYYTPNLSRTAIAASVVALELVEDPIFILNPDDSISYANRAARDFWIIPENDERSFEEILRDSDISSIDALFEQLNQGGRTQGRYLLKGEVFNQPIRVYSQEFRLQRIVRFDVQKWEAAFGHEQLLNKIVNMDTENIGVEEACSNLVTLFFDLLNIDVAIVSLRGKNQVTGSKHIHPVAARGVMLEKDFRWEMSAEVQDAFREGRCIKTDGSAWADSGVNAFVIIPIMGFQESIGAIHLGVVEPIRGFQRNKNQPANAIDVLNEDFFIRLQNAVSQLIKQALGNPVPNVSVINSIFSKLQEGLLLLDKKGKVIYATPEAYRIAESSWETMNEKRTYHVCDKDGVPLPRAKWPLFRALAEGQESYDESLVLDFGTHKKSICSSVYIRPDFLIVTMTDTSKDETRARKQEDFYSSIAHELRTPITPLKGLLQIVSRGMDRESSDFDLLDRAQKQVDRLAKLIEDMLEATRIDSGVFQIKKELVDVSKLVYYLVENWKLQFPNAQITGNFSQTVVCVLDPYRFEQVICNLIENSVKYCKGNPIIEINLSDSPFIMEIKDNGIGMSEEVLSQIFDRFYQAKTECPNHGVGIGLYVTKKIIDLHEGSISFESEIGKGTTVRVRMCSKEE